MKTTEWLFFLSTFLNQAWCLGIGKEMVSGLGAFFLSFFLCSFWRGVSGVGVSGENAIDSEPFYFGGTRSDIIVFVLGLSDGQAGRTVKI